jgi:hypothetical protein
MPTDRSSLQALKNLITEADLLLTTSPLPENRSGRAHELLTAALALVDDFRRTSKNPAATLGSKGGKATAKKLGTEHFRQLAAKRKTHAGGRPKKASRFYWVGAVCHPWDDDLRTKW